MKKPGICCDADNCREIIRVEHAADCGWLTIGGERRGRYRLDLCPYHAREAIKLISLQQVKRRKRWSKNM